MTPTSPVNANGDIFIRTAITETVNAKFLAVGEKNTQVLNNADLYLGRLACKNAKFNIFRFSCKRFEELE